MNDLNGYRIEFHILQSFPVTCLNRDDVGSPKSAMVGGVPRARVSSQCWKRQVRLQLRELGVKTALRTKQVAEVLTRACVEAGAEAEKAKTFSEAFAKALVDDTLLFFSESEARAVAEAALTGNFSVETAIKRTLSPRSSKKSIRNTSIPPKTGWTSRFSAAWWRRRPNSTSPPRPASLMPCPRTGRTAK